MRLRQTLTQESIRLYKSFSVHNLHTNTSVGIFLEHFLVCNVKNYFQNQYIFRTFSLLSYKREKDIGWAYL